MRFFGKLIFLFSLAFLLILSLHFQSIIELSPFIKFKSPEKIFFIFIESIKFFIFFIFIFFISKSKRSNEHQFLSIVVLSIILGIFLIHTVYFFPFTVDDAFISIQYAKNLVDGKGLTFNAFERVEGYTNFLLVMIEALFLFLNLNVVFFVKLFGIMCGCTIINLIFLMSKEDLRTDSIYHFYPCLIIACNSPFVLASTAGLETQFFTLSIISGIFIFSKYKSNRGVLLSSLVLNLSIFIRPEGLIFFAIITLSRIYFVDKFKITKGLIIWFSVFFIVFIPYFLWRYNYFGELLPNTFHAKVGGYFFERFKVGENYVRSYLNIFRLQILLLIPIIQFFRGKLSNLEKTLFFCILITFLYIGYTGKDWIPQFRFIEPIIPLITLLIYTSATKLIMGLKYKILLDKNIFRFLLALVFAYFASGMISLNNIGKIHEHVIMRTKGYEYAHKELARWLEVNSKPDAKIAMMDVGIVKYYSQRYVIDITGLTDKFIAKSKGGLLDKDYNPSYILDKNPDYIVLVSTKDLSVSPFESVRTIDTKIYNEPLFKNKYQFLFSLDHFCMNKEKDKGYYLNLFERKY
jgi:arabinofuranosyltransferase